MSFPALEVNPLVMSLIVQDAPVAIGVSGGKDSDVVAFEIVRFLHEVGHAGPVILIHSDLGRVEHKDSLPTCERLASRLGLELVVVRRKAGDMMDRWLTRWYSNVERYAKLECVKLILPWSTASMRFCTSELKTAIICRDLVERYPGQTILSVSGIRRQESATRAKAPVCVSQTKLTSATYQTQGYNWHPILGWTTEDVVAYHRYHNFDLHEAYTKYGMTRVSCAYCILGSLVDLISSTMDPNNHDIYREMVELEIASTFSFQGDRWLADIAPHLLDGQTLQKVVKAKRQAVLREQIEGKIPKHLLYTKGWPTVMPTRQEAVLLSKVRQDITEVMELSIQYSDPDAILGRYAELMAKNAQRGQVLPLTAIQQNLWDLEVA